jgi:hypothetical protein
MNVQKIYTKWYGSPHKLEIELSFDPAIPLQEISSKELKAGILKDIGTPMFIEALFTTAKSKKRSKDIG